MMFPAHFWRNVLMLWLALAGLLGAAVWLDNHQDVFAEFHQAQSPAPDPQVMIAKGQQLLHLGNCMACHTPAGAAAGAGGRAFETPFGKVYSSNITPHVPDGLGSWNPNDFWRALHHGKSKDGRLLTPVFPYQHTTLITREDSDALFAALQTLTPVANSQAILKPSDTLDWPYGTSVAIAVWRSLFFTPGTYVPAPHQSAEWQRGAYLAQGLGHCAACHSARNQWGAIQAVNDFSGGLMPVLNWYAPSLTSLAETGLAAQSTNDIAYFLKSGQSNQAVASGPMAEVVKHSTQHWPDTDLLAVAVYLKDLSTQRQKEEPKASAFSAPTSLAKPSPKVLSLGAKLYEQHCEQCHQKQGEGIAGAYPALANNRAVLLKDPTNLVQAVLYGGYPAATALHPRPFGMPPYILSLEDKDIAAVLTHIRTQWGNQAPEVTVLQVHRIRALQSQ